MQKIFLDTNIVIDFLGERELFYDSAARVMTLADQKKIEIMTSPITFSTTFYILSKYESASVALEKLRKFKVLCSTSIIDDEVVEKAINSGFADFEDALQYFSALSSGCQIILSRNEKDFKKALIPVMNAQSYLETKKAGA